MKYIILSIIITVSVLIIGCQDVTIGYLLTEDANYETDSMIIKKELDTTPPSWGTWPNQEYYDLIEMGISPEEILSWGIEPTYEGYGGEGEDYYRLKWEQPWVSTPIEGIQGTQQIYVTIKEIKTTAGNADKLADYLTVRGNGILEIPIKHDIPTGRYLISLTFSNEGYSKDVNDCFTIIVK
ncbi:MULTISPECIES: hypothetical protein [Butyricimonas]|jgi:lipoprotein|uniref:hypothetical protein n=1 Tax=Butyricimonas faecihominis TaxID=1472416 RepID=UPI00266FCAFE|nr:hypothetical protein [Butyricimonas faecihominis]